MRRIPCVRLLLLLLLSSSLVHGRRIGSASSHIQIPRTLQSKGGKKQSNSSSGDLRSIKARSKGGKKVTSRTHKGLLSRSKSLPSAKGEPSLSSSKSGKSLKSCKSGKSTSLSSISSKSKSGKKHRDYCNIFRTPSPTVVPGTPTVEPTRIPVEEPTVEPTVEPVEPTIEPTRSPVEEPTIEPVAPTVEPTLEMFPTAATTTTESATTSTAGATTTEVATTTDPDTTEPPPTDPTTTEEPATTTESPVTTTTEAPLTTTASSTTTVEPPITTTTESVATTTEAATTTVATDPPTPAPTPSGPNSEVDASPFILTFVGVTDPSSIEFDDSTQQVLDYLDTWFFDEYDLNPFSELIATSGTQTGTSSSPDVTIGLNFSLLFSEDSEFIPTTSDVDVQLLTAFQQPHVQALLDALHDGSGSFTDTTNVIYSNDVLSTARIREWLSKGGADEGKGGRLGLETILGMLFILVGVTVLACTLYHIRRDRMLDKLARSDERSEPTETDDSETIIFLQEPEKHGTRDRVRRLL